MRLIPPTDRINLFCACVFMFAPAAVAGDLNPPPGAPASTMKTLDEVEPRIPIDALPVQINNPGSYYFTGDLAGVNGAVGIIINADDVTIDLRGYTMRGVPGASTGITIANGPRFNISILNGTVRDWGASGLFLPDAREAHVENILTEDNNNNGIYVGFGGVIKGCHARGNGATGLRGQAGTSIFDSTTTGNGLVGIFVESEGVILRCTSRLNGAQANIANPIEGAGIAAGDNSVIADCVATRNDRAGIETGNNCSISGCQANENEFAGILTAEGCVIAKCSVGDNVTTNNQQFQAGFYNGGVTTGAANVITDCQTDGNKGPGVYAFEHSVINNCSADANGADLDVANAGARGQSIVEEYAYRAGLVAETGGLIASSTAARNTEAGLVLHRGGGLFDSEALANGETPLAPRGGLLGVGVAADRYNILARVNSILNGYQGFRITSSNLALKCAAQQNGQVGMQTVDENYVIEFTGIENGPPLNVAQRGSNPIGGLHVRQQGTRVADAHLASNSHGLTINSSENFIHGVSATQNPPASGVNNYDVAPGALFHLDRLNGAGFKSVWMNLDIDFPPLQTTTPAEGASK